MQLSIFLTHKVIPATFPSLLKVALGKRGIYLLLSICRTRNLSPQKEQISPIFWHSLPSKTNIFLKAWSMYKVKANIGLNCHLCVVNNFYTHLATKHASWLEYCRKCVYYGERNVSFSENFAYILSE